MRKALYLLIVPVATALLTVACEGPMGPAGANGQNGKDGTNGVDANETCKLCHNSSVVEEKATEYELSKHSYGEVAFEEAGNTGCTPCHTSAAFKYVCQNNVPSTFTLNSTTGKYSNDYATVSTAAFGDITCSTCHDNLHSTYEATDFMPLTNTAPVAMTMWKGTKTINLTQDNSFSNLCVKCHQPRPLTTSTSLSDGNIIDYASLASNPTDIFYDNTVGNAAPNKLVPSYRMHVHYGTVGAVFAGVGGVEFTGSLAYENSAHTTVASCQECHMADVSGRAGGHTFSAAGNFNGCNVAECHGSSPISSSNATFWKNPRADIQNLLNTLATMLNSAGAGTDILHGDASPDNNLWAGTTAGNYDGYLNIYDPSSNPTGVWKNPGSTSSYTTEQKAINNALPTFPSLMNVQVGAMINFQFCLREFSLGIHNYKYEKALLQNSIDALTAAGI
jgi:hypothetical protein